MMDCFQWTCQHTVLESHGSTPSLKSPSTFHLHPYDFTSNVQVKIRFGRCSSILRHAPDRTSMIGHCAYFSENFLFIRNTIGQASSPTAFLIANAIIVHLSSIGEQKRRRLLVLYLACPPIVSCSSTDRTRHFLVHERHDPYSIFYVCFLLMGRLGFRTTFLTCSCHNSTKRFLSDDPCTSCGCRGNHYSK
jgi:hypothetical protein